MSSPAGGKPLSPLAQSWKPNAQAQPFTPSKFMASPAKKSPAAPLNPNSKEFVPVGPTARQLAFADGEDVDENEEGEEEQEQGNGAESKQSAADDAADAPAAPQEAVSSTSAVPAAGVFVYDRETLMGLREKAIAVIPEEMIARLHQILRKTAGGDRGPGSPGRGRGAGGSPGKHGKHGSRGGAGGGGYGSRSESRRPHSRHEDPPVLLGPVKPLEKTEDGYMIQRDTTGTEKTLRMLNSILNKLTPEKFETLLEQALQLEIDTKEMLQEVAICVFEKALVEPNFCPTFAKFSVHLSEALPKFDHDKAISGEENLQINFKSLLLGYCRQEFEKKSDDLPEEQRVGMTPEDLEDARVKLKLRRLSMIRFIGELYVLNLLQGKMIKECVEQLGVARDPPDERSLESLCKLWEAVGKYIDRLPSDEDRNWATAQFKHLEEIGADQHISSRIRFMIRDLMDLRARAWIPRQRQATQQKLADISDPSRDKAAAAAASGGAKPAFRKTFSKDGSADAGRRFGGPATSGGAMQRSGSGGSAAGSAFRSAAGGSSRYSRFGAGGAAPPASGSKDKDSSAWKSGPGARRTGGASGGSGSRFTTPSKGGWSSNSKGGSQDARFASGGGRRGGKQEESVTMTNAFAALLMDEEDDQEQQESEDNDQEEEELEAEGEEHPESQVGDEDEGDLLEDEEGLDDESEEEPNDPEYDQVKKAARSLVREFLQSRDAQEAALCVEELPTQNYNYMVVAVTIMETTETCKPETCRLGSQLISALMAGPKNLLTFAQVDEGLQMQLGRWREIEVDAPLFLRYMGVIISGLVQREVLPVDWLLAAAERLAKDKRAHKLLGSVISDLSEEVGKEAAQKLLPSFCSEADVAKFLPGFTSFGSWTKEYHLQDFFA